MQNITEISDHRKWMHMIHVFFHQTTVAITQMYPNAMILAAPCSTTHQKATRQAVACPANSAGKSIGEGCSCNAGGSESLSPPKRYQKQGFDSGLFPESLA